MTEEPKKPGWEQQAISKVAQIALARIVEAEQITIHIDTTLRQIIKGEITAIAIQLQQFLMRESLTVTTLQLQIGQVIVSPREARRGKILLLQPARGILRIAIAESALSWFVLQEVRQQLKLTATTTSQSATNQIAVDTLGCFLSQADMILVRVQWRSHLEPFAEPLEQSTLSITPAIVTTSSTVEVMTQVIADATPPAELMRAIQQSLTHILNLRDFANRGTQFHIQSVAIAAHQLVLHANAEILEFPSQ